MIIYRSNDTCIFLSYNDFDYNLPSRFKHLKNEQNVAIMKMPLTLYCFYLLLCRNLFTSKINLKIN